MSSNISGPTRVIDDETMVQNTRSKIAEKMRQIPRVDGNGREIKAQDPTITDVVNIPAITGQTPTMAEALKTAAASLGVNLPALVDSARFVSALASIDDGDTEALESAIGAALVANPGLAISQPRMKRNPAQGGSASPVPPGPKSIRDQIAEMLSN